MPHPMTFVLLKNQAVASLNSVESPVADLTQIRRVESVQIRLTSTGSPDVKIEYGVSASEDESPYFHELVASTNTDFPTNVGRWIIIPVPNPLGDFFRIRVTGVGSNPADTVVDAHLRCHEGSKGS